MNCDCSRVGKNPHNGCALQCGTRDESLKLQLGKKITVGLQAPFQEHCASLERQWFLRVVCETLLHVKKYMELEEVVADVKQLNNEGRKEKQH